MAAAEPKVQQLLVDLLKTIANGETPESVEEFGSIEEMLSQLVQQLDGSELQGELQGALQGDPQGVLQGEQVLAGIDLSSLVEQLHAITAEEGGAEKLVQLVSELAEQVNAGVAIVADSEQVNDAALLESAEQVAAVMPATGVSQDSGQLAANLREARQILQKAINTVAPQNEKAGQEVAVAEEAVDGQELIKAGAGEEKVDPRFANLLKPRNQNQPSLREQVRGNNAKPAEAAVAAPVAKVTDTDVAPESGKSARAIDRSARQQAAAAAG